MSNPNAPPQAATTSNPNPNIHNIQAPTFSAAPLSAQAQQAVSARGTPATLNLDDIFGDCFFTPEGDTVFLSEHQQFNNNTVGNNNNGSGDLNNNNNINNNIQLSGETQVANVASRPIITNDAGQQQYVPVAQAGGIATTGLATAGARATTMGPAATTTTTTTMQQQQQQHQHQQQQHQLPKPTPMVAPPQQRHHLQFATTIPRSTVMNATVASKKRAGASARERKMSDQQKSERR